jgi:ABC-type multidrug transport system ATPase subunit
VIPAALDLRDVTVRYGARTTNCPPALDAATLAVEAGACVGVVGGPGSGTTSLLLAAAGLVGPDSGRVRWFGSHRWADGRPAYAPASANGHPYLSVRAWLDFAAAQLDNSPGGPEPDVAAAMAHADLGEVGRIRVGRLTRGIAARVALAGALLVTPRVLLYDRPFDVLTVAERARLAQVLRRLRRTGLTMVVATRDATALTMLTPDRIYYLAGGRIGPASPGDAALELEVPLPIEARSRLAVRVPAVYRRGRAIRVPLAGHTAEQVLSECRALGIEVRASRVVHAESPTRRRVAEGTGGRAAAGDGAPSPAG